MWRWPFARKRDDVAEVHGRERGRGTRGRVERLDPQSAYAMWARDYPARPHNRLMEIEHATVTALLPEVRGLMVLDAGCGTGRYLRELESRGARAIGMDLSMPMLKRTAAGRVARADIRALPLGPKSLDLVVCGLALGDIAELELALMEIARTLRPSGRVIYSVVHPAGEAAGWSRSFESAGRHLAVDGHWHSLERHRQACEDAGFSIEEWREPALAELPGQQAVLVVRARR
jgi:malonyl-CoA O-methyltransferase